MKFALNVIAGAGTVGILLPGGWLFPDGKTDIGTVVASLTAFRRVNDPWREMIEFYRMLSTVRIRFELLLTHRTWSGCKVTGKACCAWAAVVSWFVIESRSAGMRLF